MAIELYTTRLSAHGHRVELLLRALNLPHRIIDTPPNRRGESWFLKLNLFGQIPVLVDGDMVLADSNAQLVYLAKRYDNSRKWLPDDPHASARVQRWLSVAAGQIAYGPALSRNVKQFGGSYDLCQAVSIAENLFSILDAHLEDRKWLADLGQDKTTPTIADLACFGYVSLAPEGGHNLAVHTNIERWLSEVRALPFFHELPSLIAARPKQT